MRNWSCVGASNLHQSQKTLEIVKSMQVFSVLHWVRKLFRVGPRAASWAQVAPNELDQVSANWLCWAEAGQLGPKQSGQGPAGPGAARGIAVGLLSSPKERGAAAPAADHPPRVAKISCVLQFFLLLPIFYHFSDLVAQDGSTWGNIGPKIGQHSLKMGQHSPKLGPT